MEPHFFAGPYFSSNVGFASPVISHQHGRQMGDPLSGRLHPAHFHRDLLLYLFGYFFPVNNDHAYFFEKPKIRIHCEAIKNPSVLTEGPGMHCDKDHFFFFWSDDFFTSFSLKSNNSLGSTSSARAIANKVLMEGFRTPRSIRPTWLTAIPARCASSSWLIFLSLRTCRSLLPNARIISGSRK